MMTRAAPAGYLAWGNLSHPMQRARVCRTCREPFTSVNPIQLTCSPACQRARKVLLAKRRAKVQRVMKGAAA